jgi:hypothetical protein
MQLIQRRQTINETVTLKYIYIFSQDIIREGKGSCTQELKAVKTFNTTVYHRTDQILFVMLHHRYAKQNNPITQTVDEKSLYNC